MATKKYPIGTKIKFISNYEDCKDKTGKIVGIIYGAPLIYLPKSKCVSCFSTPWTAATVQCGWHNIEPFVIEKNQQLVFEFME